MWSPWWGDVYEMCGRKMCAEFGAARGQTSRDVYETVASSWSKALCEVDVTRTIDGLDGGFMRGSGRETSSRQRRQGERVFTSVTSTLHAKERLAGWHKGSKQGEIE
jgi:hypothetical protein